MFQLAPFAYGLTNFGFVLAAMAGVVGLVRSLRMPAGVAILGAFLWALNFHGSLTRALARSWPLFIPLPIYLGLRFQTEAMLPTTAPWFYRPTFELSHLARNVAEYADRACTFSAAAVLLALCLFRRRPLLQPAERRCLLFGAIWLVGAYGLTVFAPLRSSLYAVLPSVGSALAAAVVLGALWRAADAGRRRLALAAAVLLPVALIPVYRSRNVRLVRAAEFAAGVVADLQYTVPDLRAGKVLVLHDAPGAKATVANSFGALVEEAVRVTTGITSARVWVEPPLPDWASAGLQQPPGPAVHYWIRDGRLVSVDGRPLGHAPR